MKNFYRKKMIAGLLMLLICFGCNGIDPNTAISLGGNILDVLTHTEKRTQSEADQYCKKEDNAHAIKGPNTSYDKRLRALIKGIDPSVNKVTLNFKVYDTNNGLNAFAMANGCVRIDSDLMDILNDDEVRGVLAHEIGHVALKHSYKGNKLAKVSNLALDVVASSGAKVLNNDISQIAVYGGIGLINSQFSQKQEMQADNYSVDMMIKNNKPSIALATGLEKLEKEADKRYGKNKKKVGDSLFSSHPDVQARVKNIIKRAHAQKK